MASKRETKTIKRASYVHIQKLLAGVALLAFIVVVVAGLMAGAGVVSICIRATLVILTVILVRIFVIQILEAYEEMNSGKA